jgi:hypothetical protein
MILIQFLRSISSAKMFIVYKRKNQKMKFSDICVSDDSKFDDDVTWKENVIKKKKYFKDFTNQFVEFFISKFSELTKKARLKSERIQKMQIKDELLTREKKLFLKMLFNREIALFWNFIEKDSVRSKVTSLMKIRTMSHEAWQILEFQILKTLIEIVAEMIKNRIKNDVFEFCYEFYRNSWFLIKKKKKEKCRLINAALKMNWLIIRNANLSLRWTSFQKNLLIALLSRWWICFSNMINYRWLKNVKTWSSLWRRSIWWEWLRFSWKQSILWLNSFE